MEVGATEEGRKEDRWVMRSGGRSNKKGRKGGISDVAWRREQPTTAGNIGMLIGGGWNVKGRGYEAMLSGGGVIWKSGKEGYMTWHQGWGAEDRFAT